MDYTGAVERKVNVVVRRDADGTYLASSRDPQVRARGRSVREAVASLQETVMLALESDRTLGDGADTVVDFAVELDASATGGEDGG